MTDLELHPSEATLGGKLIYAEEGGQCSTQKMGKGIFKSHPEEVISFMSLIPLLQTLKSTSPLS